MDVIDPFTQQMLEKTRQRRELLAKKLAETSPTAQPRKRRTPLSEDTSDNVQQTVDTQNDDSPKRQCLREQELSVKADTPAIIGVRSRLKILTEKDTGEAEADFSTEPSDDIRPTPASRSKRLAMLAKTINSWEDDSGHPRPQPKEESKKKIWQAPSAAESKASPNKPPRNISPMRNDVPSTPSPNKPPRNFTKRENEGLTANTSPAKPVRKFAKTDASNSTSRFVSPNNSPTKQAVISQSTSVSTLTVTLGSAQQKEVPLVVKPGRTSGGLDVSRLSEAEPTKKPVADRLAVWQKKVSDTSPLKKNTGPSEQPVPSKSDKWGKPSTAPVTTKPPAKPVMSVDRSKVSIVNSIKKADQSLNDSINEPTKKSVHSRMAIWQQRTAETEKEAQLKSPGVKKKYPSASSIGANPAIVIPEGPAPSKPPRLLDPSPVKSPAKSPSKSISRMHEQLFGSNRKWQENDISEQTKMQKQADIAVLENRWKKGVLTSEPTTEGTGQQVMKKPDVPRPPVVSSSNLQRGPHPAAQLIKAHLDAAPQSPDKPALLTSQEKKKEEARQKIREEEPMCIDDPEELYFENKLSAMGFEVKGSSKVAEIDLTPYKKEQAEKERAEKERAEKEQAERAKAASPKWQEVRHITYTERKLPPPDSPPKPVSRPAVTSPSLYNLVKQSSTTSVQAATKPGPTPFYKSTEQTNDDSFESSFSDDDSEYSRTDDCLPAYGYERRRNSIISGTSAYSDSQSDVHTVDSTSEWTEDDTCGGDYTADESASSSHSDGSDGEGDISDLLNEALDESEMARGPQLPIHHYESTSSKPPLPRPVITKKDSFKKPGPVRSVNFLEPLAKSTSAESVSSDSNTDSDSHQPIVYSVDLYRTNKSSAPAPRMTVVRHSEHEDRETAEEPIPFIPEKSAKEKIKELNALVWQEQNIIMQTSNALNKCCGKDSSFIGSSEQVECNRLLLIACKKREAYLSEIQKLQDGRSTVGEGGPRGSLTISDIRLPLKSDFLNKRGTMHDTSVHYFVCMLRSDAHVIVTQMVCTHDANIRGSLDITNLMKLNNVKQDFHYSLEIYGMYISRESLAGHTPKKEKKQNKLTPKKIFSSKGHHSTLQSPGGPMAVRTTNFALIATLPITVKCLNRSQFTLDRVPYSSPLQGTISLKIRCIMESSVSEKGFLTMFEDVSGFGAWHRRWFVLNNHTLSFWKYPDDETRKVPIGTLDLKRCISDVIGLIPRDICARPNTFELVCIRPQRDGERDTLVSHTYNTMTTIRHMLSADTKSDRLLWCDKLNEALRNVRAWHSDAMRPIKRKDSDTESSV